jgi:hypothetical protein
VSIPESGFLPEGNGKATTFALIAGRVIMELSIAEQFCNTNHSF